MLRGFYLSNSLKWTTSGLPALSSPPTLHHAFHTVAPGAFSWDLTNTKPGLHTALLSLPRAPSSSCSPNSLALLPFSSRPQSRPLQVSTPALVEGSPQGTLTRHCVFLGYLIF